jgi:hypothetical protein
MDHLSNLENGILILIAQHLLIAKLCDKKKLVEERIMA